MIHPQNVHFFKAASCAASLALGLGTAAIAESPAVETQVNSSTFVEDTGSADRIFAADRLRALTQEVAGATCLISNGIMSEDNQAVLSRSAVEFDALLNALLRGDAQYEIIGAETNPTTIQEIELTMAEWAPLNAAAQVVMTDPSNTESVQFIYDKTPHLLETASELLTELEDEYTHPSQVLLTDVVRMELSGSQAMLTQKIAYESCLVWSGVSGAEKLEDIKAMTSQVEQIARALRDGMPAIGVAKAPTPEIASALDKVLQGWSETVTHVERLTSAGDLGMGEVTWISKKMAEKTKLMEEIARMYTEFSHRTIV